MIVVSLHSTAIYIFLWLGISVYVYMPLSNSKAIRITFIQIIYGLQCRNVYSPQQFAMNYNVGNLILVLTHSYVAILLQSTWKLAAKY